MDNNSPAKLSFKGLYENKEKHYIVGIIEENLRYAVVVTLRGEDVDMVNAAGDVFQIFYGLTEEEFGWRRTDVDKLNDLVERIIEGAPRDRLILYRVARTKNSLPGNSGRFEPKTSTIDDIDSPSAYINAVVAASSMEDVIDPETLHINELVAAILLPETLNADAVVKVERTNDLNCLIHVANNMMKDRKPVQQHPEKMREIFGELELRLRSADTLWMAVADNGEPYTDQQELPWVFTEQQFADKAQHDMKARGAELTIAEKTPAELFSLLKEKGFSSFQCDVSHAGVNVSLECMFLGNYSVEDMAAVDIHQAIKIYNAAKKQADRQGAPASEKTRAEALIAAFYEKFVNLPEIYMMYHKNTSDTKPTIDQTGCAWFFTEESRAQTAVEKNEGIDFAWKKLTAEEAKELYSKEFYRIGIVRLRIDPGAGEEMAEIARDDLGLMENQQLRAMENRDAISPELNIRMWGFHNSLLQFELLRFVQAVNIRSENQNVMANALTHMDALYKEIARTQFLVPITFEGEEDLAPEMPMIYISKASIDKLQENKRNLIIYTGGTALRTAPPTVNKPMRYYTLQNKENETVWLPVFTDYVEFKRIYGDTKYRIGVMTYDELLVEAKKHNGMIINCGGMRLQLTSKEFDEIEKRKNTPHVIYSTDPILAERAKKKADAQEAAKRAAEEKVAAEKKALEDQLEAKKQEFQQYKRSILGDKAAKKKAIMKEILALEEQLKKYE